MTADRPTTAASADFRLTLLDGSTWTEQGIADFGVYLSQQFEMRAEARQPDSEAHQHPLYDCGGKGHGSDASEVRWCHDCTPHRQPDSEALAAIDAGTHEPAVDDFGNQYLAALPPSAPPEHDINCGIDALRLGEDIGCTCGADREAAPPSAPPALHVERLAEALCLSIHVTGQWSIAPVLHRERHRTKARSVAVEYARLASQPGEPQPVNDDEHWHRGPSQSCSICRFAGIPPSETQP